MRRGSTLVPSPKFYQNALTQGRANSLNGAETVPFGVDLSGYLIEELRDPEELRRLLRRWWPKPMCSSPR